MHPLAIATEAACRRRRGLQRITLQPFGDVKVKELLVPDHSGERLALHCTRIRALDTLLQLIVELVALANSVLEHPLKVCESLCCGRVGEAQAHLPDPA